MIQNLMKEGKLIDANIVVRLIQKAMLQSQNDKFLIDGFPRNEENRQAFEKIVRHNLFGHYHFHIITDYKIFLGFISTIKVGS
jgi:adenylate kinase family enzyme